MKIWIFLAVCTLVFLPGACAFAENLPDTQQLAPLYEFAREFGSEKDVRNIYESALSDGNGLIDAFAGLIQGALGEPLRQTASRATEMLPVLILAALVGCMDQGEKNGARFLIRIQLILLAFECTAEAILACESCIASVRRFTDGASPLLAFMLTAIRMEGSAALVSPAAAFAGDLAADCFLKYGIPLCRIGLCISSAGNLCPGFNPNGLSRLLRKGVNWGSGLAISVFTALLALQGSISEGLDGVGVRAARYAVDSASPIIGSGVSEAWESYVSGMMVAKNAVGISGIAALIAAGAKPVLICLLFMLVLQLAAAALELIGEGTAAGAMDQFAGICRMALSLCTASLAIAMILLGGVMAAGKSMLH